MREMRNVQDGQQSDVHGVRHELSNVIRDVIWNLSIGIMATLMNRGRSRHNIDRLLQATIRAVGNEYALIDSHSVNVIIRLRVIDIDTNQNFYYDQLMISSNVQNEVLRRLGVLETRLTSLRTAGIRGRSLDSSFVAPDGFGLQPRRRPTARTGTRPCPLEPPIPYAFFVALDSTDGPTFNILGALLRDPTLSRRVSRRNPPGGSDTGNRPASSCPRRV